VQPPWPPEVKFAFDAGILDPEEHEPLLRNYESVARLSGVPLYEVCRSIKHTCADLEVRWVQRFRRHAVSGKAGLLYLGTEFQPPYVERAMAICAALIRNFVDARVVSSDALVSQTWDGDEPNPTCMAVVDFAVPGRSPQARRALASVVVDRALKGKQTILQVPSLAVVRNDFGGAVADLIGSQRFYVVR